MQDSVPLYLLLSILLLPYILPLLDPVQSPSCHGFHEISFSSFMPSSHIGKSKSPPLTTSPSIILTGSVGLFQQPTEFSWFIFFPFSNLKWWLIPPHFADYPQVLLKAQEFSFQVLKCSLAQSIPQPQLQRPSEAQCSWHRASPVALLGTQVSISGAEKFKLLSEHKNLWKFLLLGSFQSL